MLLQVLITTQANADIPRLLHTTQGSRILQQQGQQLPAATRDSAAIGATSAVAPTHTATTGAPSKSQPTVSTTTTGQHTATPKPQQPVPAVTPGSRPASVQPPTAAAVAASAPRQPVTASAPAARVDLSDREPTFKPYLCNTGAEMRPCHNVTNSAGTAAKLTAGQGRVRDNSLPQRGGADSGVQLAQWAKQQTRSDVTWKPVVQPGAQPPAKTVGEHVLSTQPGVAAASD